MRDKLVKHESRTQPSSSSGRPSSAASTPDSGAYKNAEFECWAAGCGVWFHSEVGEVIGALL